MIDWRSFDRVMREIEWLYAKNKLSFEVVKCLKRNKCWRNNEPFCSYDFFTYTMSDKQIRDVCDTFNNFKGSN